MVATCLRVGGLTRQSKTLPSCSSTWRPLDTCRQGRQGREREEHLWEEQPVVFFHVQDVPDTHLEDQGRLQEGRLEAVTSKSPCWRIWVLRVSWSWVRSRPPTTPCRRERRRGSQGCRDILPSRRKYFEPHFLVS